MRQIQSRLIYGASAFTMITLAAAPPARAQSLLATDGDARYAIRAVYTIGENEERTYEGVIHLAWSGFGPGGVNVVSGRFESLNADVVLFNERKQYECRLEGGEGVLPFAEAWSDEALAAVRFTVGAPLEIALNDAGEIERIAGLHRIDVMSEVIGQEIDDALGPFMPGQIGRALEPIFSADGATAPPSDSWETTRQWPLGAARSTTVNGAWRLNDGDDDVATFVADLTLAVEQGEAASSLSPVVETTDLEGSASATWDLRNGALLEREQTMRFTAQWSVRDIVETLNITSQVTITRLNGEADGD